MRCDGKKPVCSQCEKRGDNVQDCVYTLLANSAKRISEQEYVVARRSRPQHHRRHVANCPVDNQDTSQVYSRKCIIFST